MNLRNYTSKVPAFKSIQRIETLLVRLGASNINKQYKDESLSAISFLITVNGITIAFKLPAKVEVVDQILWAEVKRPNLGTRERIKQQAERTAWKIVCDWVEVQAAMIQLEQAEFVEVFLPYVYDFEKGQTFYHRLKANNFKLLPGAK